MEGRSLMDAALNKQELSVGNGSSTSTRRRHVCFDQSFGGKTDVATYPNKNRRSILLAPDPTGCQMIIALNANTPSPPSHLLLVVIKLQRHVTALFHFR
jgi:hypothetical protein